MNWKDADLGDVCRGCANGCFAASYLFCAASGLLREAGIGNEIPPSHGGGISDDRLSDMMKH